MFLSSYISNRISKYKIIFFKRLFYFFPVDKYKIVFNNFNGKGFGDNPRYIAEEIFKQDLPYKLFWICNKTAEVPNWINRISMFSIRGLYTLATSRVIINNVKNGLPYFKKKSQYYIQTWHGSLIMKYLEKEVEDKLSRTYVNASKADSKLIDCFLVASNDDERIIKSNFWYDHEILRCGCPRSDVFFKKSVEYINQIKEKLEIPLKNKVVMYAPTFRDDFSVNGYKIDTNRILNALKIRFGNNWSLIIRLHPNVTVQDSVFHFNENVINVCNYPDAQDLSLIADIMITDYSSIMLDAFLQGKPVFLYTSDYEEYIKNRPMHSIYKKLPCNRCATNDELIQTILNFDSIIYQANLDKFLNITFHSYDDGLASKRVVERINDVINSGYQSPYIS